MSYMVICSVFEATRTRNGEAIFNFNLETYHEWETYIDIILSMSSMSTRALPATCIRYINAPIETIV